MSAAASDKRRSSLNPDWLLDGDQWVHAPLPSAPTPSSDAAPAVSAGPVFEDFERDWFASDEARAQAAAAADPELDAEQKAAVTMAAVDAAMAGRMVLDAETVADLDAYIASIDPAQYQASLDATLDAYVAELTAAPLRARAQIDAKWDKANAAAEAAQDARRKSNAA